MLMIEELFVLHFDRGVNPSQIPNWSFCKHYYTVKPSHTMIFSTLCVKLGKMFAKIVI